MFPSRKYLICLMLGLLFVFGTSSAAAAPAATGSTTTRRVVRESFTFVMTPEQCPRLSEPLYGQGNTIEVIKTTTFANGSKHIVDDAVKTGTAWDSTGTYRFEYANHFIQDVPPSGSPIKNFMADIFTVHGNGSLRRLTTGFVWSWTGANFPGEGPVEDFREIAKIGEGIACDPI